MIRIEKLRTQRPEGKLGIITAVIALFTACNFAFAAEIELTIEPVTNMLLITEASQRMPTPSQDVLLTSDFPHPDTRELTRVPAFNVVRLPDNPSDEVLAWSKTNAFQLDFFACIRNISTNRLNFYSEWNSWGFNSLKIVCYGWQEIWISKQPGAWYRNFPSWVTLEPGAILRIPVAFDESLWSGVQKSRMAGNITGIRVFYDQLQQPTNRWGITSAHWQGCEFSRNYDIGEVLPRRGFKMKK